MPRDGRPALPNELRSTLDELWQTILRSTIEDVARRQLREPARQIALRARIAGLSADQLIIALKEDWLTHRDGSVRSRYRTDAQELFSDLVSLCIREYYHPPPPTDGALKPRRPATSGGGDGVINFPE